MTILGWILAVGGGVWMLVSLLRYRWGDPLNVMGESIVMDQRWMTGALVLLIGVRLLTGTGIGVLFLLLLGAWLAIIPLKMVAGRRS